MCSAQATSKCPEGNRKKGQWKHGWAEGGEKVSGEVREVGRFAGPRKEFGFFSKTIGKPLENFKKVYEESDLIFFYNKVIMIIKKKTI